VKNILALMQASSGVVFPVDDLYGKVDLPIVLLEALALGVPVFALAEGPLLDLDGAELLGADPRDWASALARLLRSPHGRQEMAALGKKAVSTRFAAEHVAGQYGRVYQSLW
jgi:phosphatidylinositol alpha-1,6-mannosyltransferase